ncbi:MAG: hypothetical protein RL385_3813, partial [Pseudomonadota bacterium]
DGFLGWKCQFFSHVEGSCVVREPEQEKMGGHYVDPPVTRSA